jgi:hydrogenase large subunit
LEWQKEIVKVHTIFGGKNPHPNYIVGGVPCSININEVNALNTERLNLVAKLFKEAKIFVEQVYIPDLLAIAEFYKAEWTKYGGGLKNYLAYGDLPTKGINNPEGFLFPRGIVLDRDLSKVHEVDPKDKDGIKEYIAHSWYEYSKGDQEGLHPWEGETKLKYTGPKPPYKFLDTNKKYSWLKTPRWKGKPMEVGPLARMVVAYASGRKEVQESVNGVLRKLNAPVDALFSTLGRTAARGIETQLIAEWSLQIYDKLLQNIKNGNTTTHTKEKWDSESWPETAKGVGMTEAPRGALAHWIVIKDKRIENYQLVVPSTWNASPKDPMGNRSAYEESLIGTRLAKIDQPVEILRTIHSFDPCLACAVHLYDPEGKHIAQVRVM